MENGHSFSLTDRARATFTGVNDVKSFDETEVVLSTKQGMLTIQGSSLHVKRLSLEKGEADIEGQVDKMMYSSADKIKDGYKSFAARIFR